MRRPFRKRRGKRSYCRNQRIAPSGRKILLKEGLSRLMPRHSTKRSKSPQAKRMKKTRKRRRSPRKRKNLCSAICLKTIAMEMELDFSVALVPSPRTKTRIYLAKIHLKSILRVPVFFQGTDFRQRKRVRQLHLYSPT